MRLKYLSAVVLMFYFSSHAFSDAILATAFAVIYVYMHVYIVYVYMMFIFISVPNKIFFVAFCWKKANFCALAIRTYMGVLIIPPLAKPAFFRS